MRDNSAEIFQYFVRKAIESRSGTGSDVHSLSPSSISSADSEKRMEVFEIKCLRKLLRISYSEHKTNDWVRSKINFLVGSQEPLLATVKRRNLHGSGMSHATKASPKPSFRAPWRVGDAVADKGNAGRTT